MERIILAFSAEEIEKIDEMCDLLSLTRPEYLGKLFAWGRWVVDQSKEGKTIISAHEDFPEQCEFLSSPKLDELRESWKQVAILSSKK